jgi:hypothetical protein
MRRSTCHTLAAGELLEHQVVWTYTPDRWPAGLISGEPTIQHMFRVRHIVTFRRGILLAMLHAGVEAAREQGYVALLITIPVDFPPALGLLRVARRLGFESYAIDPAAYHVVRYL